MNKPLLSIVIVNYNYGRFLEDAVRSVIDQEMGDKVELIICDAASTDNSIEVIKKYANGLPPNTYYSDWLRSAGLQYPIRNPPLITWWCSEKDGGQSAGFNKGFSHAQGRFLTWLNADDVFIPGALKAFEIAAKKSPECEWFAGGGSYLDEKLSVVQCHRARRFSEVRALAGQLQVFAPSSFFSNKLLMRCGGKIDETFNYLMDIELWERFYYLGKMSYLTIPAYCWGLRLHRDAKMSGHDFADSAFSNPEHPAWERKRHERQVIDAKYRKKPLTHLSRFFSARFVTWLAGKIDTWRYRGKSFKTIGQVASKVKIGYLSWHPAPYRDDFLKRIIASDRLDVTVYTAKANGDEHTFTPPDYPTEILMPSRRSSLGVLWRMLHKMVFGRFDYTFWPGFMSWPVITCEVVLILLGKKYVFCTDCVAEHKTSVLKKWLRTLIIKHSFAIIVGGNAGRHFFRTEYSISNDRILDGVYSLEGEIVEKKILEHRKDKDSIRSQYGLRSEDRVFLMVANITPKRCYPITVAGFRSFASRHEKCRFVICGTGAGLAEMQRIAEEDNAIVVIPGVTFDDMLKLYAMSDVYVHGGKEPASTALQIGAIAHLPLVSSKAIGLAWDVLVDNESGVEVLDYTSVVCWGEAFEKILANENAWLDMGAKARGFSAKLDAKCVATQFVEYFS